ncbi:MAG: hypothetical protein F4X64_10270 [Chloroflexi bacterium]|nr:hypothetical protein [Chloroflexota bacterium]
MVLADWLRAKYVTPLQEQRKAERERRRAEEYAEGFAEGHAQGYAEGIAEANRVWRAWNRRRMEAEERGETCNEPEPYQDEE